MPTVVLLTGTAAVADCHANDDEQLLTPDHRSLLAACRIVQHFVDQVRRPSTLRLVPAHLRAFAGSCASPPPLRLWHAPLASCEEKLRTMPLDGPEVEVNVSTIPIVSERVMRSLADAFLGSSIRHDGHRDASQSSRNLSPMHQMRQSLQLLDCGQAVAEKKGTKHFDSDLHIFLFSPVPTTLAELTAFVGAEIGADLVSCLERVEETLLRYMHDRRAAYPRHFIHWVDTATSKLAIDTNESNHDMDPLHRALWTAGLFPLPEHLISHGNIEVALGWKQMCVQTLKAMDRPLWSTTMEWGDFGNGSFQMDLFPVGGAIPLPARPPTAYTFHGIVSCAESRTVKCHATGTYGPFLAATRDRSVQQLLAGMSRSTAALVFHAATSIMVVLPLVDAAAHVYVYDAHADIAEIFPMASRELGRIAELPHASTPMESWSESVPHVHANVDALRQQMENALSHVDWSTDAADTVDFALRKAVSSAPSTTNKSPSKVNSTATATTPRRASKTPRSKTGSARKAISTTKRIVYKTAEALSAVYNEFLFGNKSLKTFVDLLVKVKEGLRKHIGSRYVISMVRHARQHLLADIKRTRYKWLVHHARALGVEPDPMTVEVLRDVGTSGTGIDAAQQSAFDGWRNWVLNMYEGDNSSAVTVAERQPTLMPLCRAMMIRDLQLQVIVMLECIRSLSSPEPSVLAAIEAAGCKRDDLITVIKNDVEDAVDFLCIQLSTPPEFHDSAMPSALRSLTSSALFYDESAFQEGVVHHARFTRSIPVVAKALASKFSVSFFSPVKPVVKRKRTFTSAQSFSLMGGGSALPQSQLSTADCYADVSSQPGAVSKFLRRGSVENMEASNLDWTMMGGNSSNHVISGNHHRSSSQSGRTHSTSGSQLPAFAKKPMFMMSVSTAAKGSKVATMERGGGASKVKSFAQRSSAPSNMAMAGGSQSLLKRLQDVNIKAKSTVRAATFYGGMPSKTANGSGTVAKNNATITSTTAQSPSHMAFDDILMTPEKKRSRIGSKRTSLMHDVQHDAPGEDDVLVFETPARPTTRSSATKARRAILDDDEVVPDTPVVDRCA